MIKTLALARLQNLTRLEIAAPETTPLTLSVVQSEIAKRNKIDALNKKAQSLTFSAKGADKAKKEAIHKSIEALKKTVESIKASRKTSLSLGQLVAKRDALRKKK
jgi:hypothetical protein